MVNTADEQKPYFVILWQEEIEMIKSSSTLAVYQAVKSFTANGTEPCKKSFLAISKRARVTDKTAKEKILDLIHDNLLLIEGTGTSRGGTFFILRILPEFVKRDTRTSDSLRTTPIKKLGATPNSPQAQSSDLTPGSSESSRLNSKQSNRKYIKSNADENISTKNESPDTNSLSGELAQSQTSDELMRFAEKVSDAHRKGAHAG